MSTGEPRRRVLFVQNDPELRRIYDATFGSSHEVAFAATAAEACVLLREFRPELVVIDMHLPDGSGLEVLKRLRARNGVLPVVLTTGGPEQAEALARSGLSIERILYKPIGRHDLAAALGAVG